jgi:hypothetical protein
VTAVGTIHQIKVTLREVHPLVWRRVHLPSTACPAPKLAHSAGLRFRTSSSGSAILTNQTADGASSLYSSREIDHLGRIVKGLA